MVDDACFTAGVGYGVGLGVWSVVSPQGVPAPAPPPLPQRVSGGVTTIRAPSLNDPYEAGVRFGIGFGLGYAIRSVVNAAAVHNCLLRHHTQTLAAAERVVLEHWYHTEQLRACYDASQQSLRVADVACGRLTSEVDVLRRALTTHPHADAVIHKSLCHRIEEMHASMRVREEQRVHTDELRTCYEASQSALAVAEVACVWLRGDVDVLLRGSSCEPGVMS